jgi:transcriptional regulator with XRE-family HTH domain
MIGGNNHKQETPDSDSEFAAGSRNPLGARIRRIWEESGLTQTVFSSTLDITSVSLQNYMKGTRIPDAKFIAKLAEWQNICFEWIMTGNGPMRSDVEIEKRGMEGVLTKAGEKVLMDIYGQLVEAQQRELELLREKINTLQEENSDLKSRLSFAETKANTA